MANFGEKITIDPEQIVSEDVMSQVGSLILRNMANDDAVEAFQSFETQYFINNVGYDFVNSDGRITRRISKYLRDNFSYRMGNQEVSLMGNLISGGMRRGTAYQVIIDQGQAILSMRDGEFGDSGACFYGAYRNRLLTMAHSDDFYVMKVYDASDRGIGRCWIYNTGDDYVFFNVYGIQVREAKFLASQFFGEATKPVSLGSTIYINESSTFGIIRSDATSFNPRPTLYWHFCVNCRSGCQSASDYAIGGQTYCRTCYRSRNECSICQDVYISGGSVIMDAHVCDACAASTVAENFWTCDRCGDLHNDECDERIAALGKDVCSSCSEIMFRTGDVYCCVICSEVGHGVDSVNIGQYHYCYEHGLEQALSSANEIVDEWSFLSAG